MESNFTNGGAFLGTTGNLPQNNVNDINVSHHLTLTGDIGGGIMKAHDTFQVGSQSINISGQQYNNLNGVSNNFNPSPGSAPAFRSLFNDH